MESTREGYDPQLFEEIAALEEASFWFSERNRLILWALNREVPAMRDYLEVGCGTGHVLAAVAGAFPAARCAGVEPFEAGLEIAARRVPGAELRRGDAASLDESAAYDAIGCFDVIEHIADDRGALRQMAGALRPGGTLLLTVPQHAWLWSDADERAEHVRRYRHDELKEKVRDSGLEVVLSSSFVTTLLPLLAIARLIRRHRPPQDPLSELRLAPWVQALLRPAVSLDRFLIRSGVSLPAGGSLLLIARRTGAQGDGLPTSSAIA